MIIIPFGHDDLIVERLPFVTIGIIVICAIAFFPTSSKMEDDREAEEQFGQQHDLVGVAETQVLRSSALRMMGRVTEALALVTSALNRLETLEADDRLIAWAIRTRGIARGTTGDITGALVDARKALELFEAFGDTYGVGMCHHEIGVNLERQGNTSGAEHHYRQS